MKKDSRTHIESPRGSNSTRDRELDRGGSISSRNSQLRMREGTSLSRPSL
uniref:Uncharacterized protein n=1 Tax=Cucumis melo TaxID=3656 RepID=A0A9I9DME3_CUCME